MTTTEQATTKQVVRSDQKINRLSLIKAVKEVQKFTMPNTKYKELVYLMPVNDNICELFAFSEFGSCKAGGVPVRIEGQKEFAYGLDGKLLLQTLALLRDVTLCIKTVQRTLKDSVIIDGVKKVTETITDVLVLSVNSDTAKYELPLEVLDKGYYSYWPSQTQVYGAERMNVNVDVLKSLAGANKQVACDLEFVSMVYVDAGGYVTTNGHILLQYGQPKRETVTGLPIKSILKLNDGWGTMQVVYQDTNKFAYLTIDNVQYLLPTAKDQVPDFEDVPNDRPDSDSVVFEFTQSYMTFSRIVNPFANQSTNEQVISIRDGHIALAANDMDFSNECIVHISKCETELEADFWHDGKLLQSVVKAMLEVNDGPVMASIKANSASTKKVAMQLTSGQLTGVVMPIRVD